MGVSCTIGGSSFAALTAPTVAGRYLIACTPESPMDDLRRYHPVGTTGNVIVDCGEAGRKVTCRLRYIDTVANVEANIAADIESWRSEVSIVYGGKTYARCTLEPGGMKKTRDLVATGRGSSYVFADVTASFICDGGVS